ncbi:MAG: hypothetical protein VKS61_06775 [Candidatus Sericytochromatia bacterium]|nr:hypothetical protein [Candidatus Sericytochromatia bacterium]
MNRLALVLPALMLAGCTAPGAPTTPGSSTAPAASSQPAASQAPTASASSAPASPAAAGAINPKLAAIYPIGRIWEYESTTASPIGPVKTTMRQEVMAIADKKAKLELRIGAMGSFTDTTTYIDLTQGDVRGAVASGLEAKPGEASWSEAAVASEQLTVKGGTFQTTKFSGKSTSAGSSFDATFWVSDEVGLIKSISKGTATAGAYALQQTLPDGFQMPAGISLPAGGVGTAPVSMQIETVTELVGLKR